MKKYKLYKDSGVDWIGKIPKHWKISKLKFNSRIKTGYTPPMAEPDNYAKEGIIWVKPNMLDEFNPIIDSDIKISDKGKKENNILPKGSVLLCCIGTIGKFGIAGTDLITNQQINGILFLNNINSEYGKYFMSSSEDELNSIANGNVVKILNTEKLGNIKIPIPTIEEQTQIGGYLDKKISQIGKLITQKKQIVQFLKEERKAIINHSVTKGINSSASMKDSDVQWLGKIPEHWDVRRTKYLFDIRKNIAGKLGYDVLSVTQKGIKIKDITSGDGQLSMDYSKYQLVKKEQFVMNHMDLLTGFVDKSQYEGVTSPDYRVFESISSESKSDYYLYLYQMFYNEKLFFPYGRGSAQAGRWRLPAIEFRDFRLPVPPVDEQEQIVAYIKTKHNEIDKTLSVLKKEIKYLNEYKTTLISEVVTGKIDVREEVLI
ncbi:restriction endonuclease subunit S [Winogradskyella poriferorum]|uniref:restriction endonuclease subunit S n=1 Tax=Winogradskyella poriferorum TaxID=307627 RepID=UPI003D6478DF